MGFYKLIGRRLAPVGGLFNWTELPPLNTALGDHEVYLDTDNGSDLNSGLDSSHAKRTLGAATNPALLRPNTGDRLFVRKGNRLAGSFLSWSRGGPDSTRPMIVSSYGSGPRPYFDTGADGFFSNDYHSTIGHLWFLGLETEATGYGGTGGGKAVNCSWPMTDVLLEDCYFHNYPNGVCFQAYGGSDHFFPNPRHTSMRLRGCIVADIWNSDFGSHDCSGVFCGNVDGLTVEGNIFDYCGWSALSLASANVFKHGLYVHAGALSGFDGGGCSDVIVRDNWGLNTDGFTIRAGGLITGNVLARTMSGIQVGMGDTAQVGGIQFNLDDNACLELQSYDPSIITIGFGVGNVGYASTIRRNILANTLRNPASDAISALWFRHPDHDVDGFAYTLNVGAPLEIRENILYRTGRLSIPDSVASYTGPTTWIANDLQTDDTSDLPGHESFRVDGSGVIATMSGQGNNFYQHGAYESGPNARQWYYRAGNSNAGIALLESDLGDSTATHTARTYPNPGRNLALYDESIGGAGTHAAFCARLRLQSKDNWDPRLSTAAFRQWFLAGFGR